MTVEKSPHLTVLDSRTQKTYVLPITNNTVNAIDFRSIVPPSGKSNPADTSEAGLTVLDRGFLNTACIESSITYIDAPRGRIQYRDQSIDHLFENNDYEEVLHLLVFSHLPTPEEKETFRRALSEEMTKVPEVVKQVIQAFDPKSSTSAMILAGLSAYAAVDEGSQALHSSAKPHYHGRMAAVDAAVVRTLAAAATTIAAVYCHKRGKPLTPADPSGSFIGNILLMMGHVDEDGKPSRRVEGCLKRLWILYADHEMTNSTAAMLHASSTLTDPISASIAGIVSAYGPLHGGAIDLAYRGFQQIGTPENVPALIGAVKARKQRLFGYGHRIYKVVDPRTHYIREMITEYATDDKLDELPFLKVALEIDRVASNDPYFTSRNLKANADLYGALLYSSLGFETDTIVAMAVMSRMGGAMAHWKESMGQSTILWRPQQVFTGLVM
ncbi:Citrate synthase [Hyphodiscus hymeniophilus]|uniref:Citrate synthase n=1 Tax=Hyphodiscus hymeniophilus TaxID=353542 RepID=A0A9P7AU45_9HELO|nr:Citrate synthase [Hyphodiscus hymeniophilus]